MLLNHQQIPDVHSTGANSGLRHVNATPHPPPPPNVGFLGTCKTAVLSWISMDICDSEAILPPSLLGRRKKADDVNVNQEEVKLFFPSCFHPIINYKLFLKYSTLRRTRTSASYLELGNLSETAAERGDQTFSQHLYFH